MKKIFALLLIALSMSVSESAWARSVNRTSAPDRLGKWDMGIGISAAANDGVDDAAYVSGSVSYGVTPYIALGVEAGWQEADGSDFNDESIGVVPVLFDVIVRWPNLHESIVPYGILGLGAIGVYATNENGAGARQGDDSDDTGFGWKLGGGIDWFLNERWIFNFEFAYLSADVDVPTASVSSDYDFWTVGVALKYVF